MKSGTYKYEKNWKTKKWKTGLRNNWGLKIKL